MNRMNLLTYSMLLALSASSMAQPPVDRWWLLCTGSWSTHSQPMSHPFQYEMEIPPPRSDSDYQTQHSILKFNVGDQKQFSLDSWIKYRKTPFSITMNSMFITDSTIGTYIWSRQDYHAQVPATLDWKSVLRSQLFHFDNATKTDQGVDWTCAVRLSSTPTPGASLPPR